MNGPADSEVDYKKKYRNLKRKLKFLIYVSAGVAGLWGVRPGARRTSVSPRVQNGMGCRRLPGPWTDRGRLSAHLGCDAGTRVLPGGTEEGTEEIAEGVPGQEVREAAGTGAREACG